MYDLLTIQNILFYSVISLIPVDDSVERDQLLQQLEGAVGFRYLF